jgi:hypothetical protein
MKMKLLLSLSCMLAGLAHAGPASVQSLPYQGAKNIHTNVEEGAIKTPFVTMDDAKVAAKVNDHLFIALYNVMAPKKVGVALGSADGVMIDGTVSQDFKVTRNDGRVLSLAFDGEGCGAYCASWRTSYNFDARTGRMLDAGDLFTAKGKEALKQKMSKERLSQYRKQLAALKKSLAPLEKKSDAKSREGAADLVERIALNSRCAGEEDPEESEPPSGDHRFELAGEAINLVAERCSSHAERALDDVDEVQLSIPYAALRPYLTAYGKSLLLGEGNAKQDSIYGQILRGKLGGTTAISMLISKGNDREVVGMVFYDRFGKPINVTGKHSGDTLVLNEVGDDGSAKVGTWQLTLSGNRLTGKWVGKKTFEVELAP